MPDILTLIAEARSAAFDHRFDTAARSAAEVLDRLPTCLPALRILAWAQLEQNEDAALETFEQCAAYDPEDALAYVGQAICYQQRGEIEAAVRLWIRAWELDPSSQAIRRVLVQLTGDLPDSPLAEAIGLLRAGREDEAADMLRRLRAVRPDATVSLTLIQALFTAGLQREAFDLAVALHTSHGQSVKVALYVAALEDRAGRTLRSREAIARAEQVDPGLKLFADVVRQVGLQSALDQHRASRTPLTAAR